MNAYALVGFGLIQQKSIHREVEERGGKCHVYRCDLTDREDVYEVAERVKAEVGTVDILINNAGIVSGSYFLDTPDSEFSCFFMYPSCTQVISQ